MYAYDGSDIKKRDKNKIDLFITGSFVS